jgi:hypothetical protein
MNGFRNHTNNTVTVSSQLAEVLNWLFYAAVAISPGVGLILAALIQAVAAVPSRWARILGARLFGKQ